LPNKLIITSTYKPDFYGSGYCFQSSYTQRELICFIESDIPLKWVSFALAG